MKQSCATCRYAKGFPEAGDKPPTTKTVTKRCLPDFWNTYAIEVGLCTWDDSHDIMNLSRWNRKQQQHMHAITCHRYPDPIVNLKTYHCGEYEE